MAPSIDRISGLPDDVICHILFFLPTKTSVSTGVLARRWRFLWTHVPKLYFKADHPKGSTQDSDIIHRVIVLHQARTIDTFHLSRVYCTDFQLATWIIHAVNQGVRNLCLNFRDKHLLDNSVYFTLPGCLFTCKTLVRATICCSRGIPSSGNVFLPSLKRLVLSQFALEEDGSLSQLLSGCPVLENLIVNWRDTEKTQNGDNLGLFFISSPTIKNLDVDVEYECQMFKINAPSLEYLKLSISSLEDIMSLTTMPSLIKARISLEGDWEENVRVINNTHYPNVLQFLNSLYNVNCLEFSIEENGKGVSVAGLDSLVKFDNLTELNFYLPFDFDEIVKFLQVADNLQVLWFTLCGMHDTYMEPKKVPTCVLSCLKTVRIKLTCGFNARDFKTIKYLLRNAQVLETMELHCYSYLCSNMKRSGRDMLRRIPLLEKGSESCQLVLY